MRPRQAAPAEQAAAERVEPQAAPAAGAPARQQAVAGGLWIALARLVPLLGTAALSVVIGRLLGPAELGLQNVVAFVDAMLAALLTWVSTTVAVRLIAAAVGARDPAAGDSAVRWGFRLTTASGLGSAVVLAAIGSLSDAPGPWLCVALASLLNGIGWGYGAKLIGTTGWSAVASRRLWTQLLATGLGIAAVVAGFGVTGVFAAIAAAAAVALVLLRMAAGPLPRGPMAPRPAGMWRMWGTVFALEALLQVVARKTEVLFLQAFSGADEVAMYSVAFMVVTTAAVLPVSLMTASLPAVAGQLGAGGLARAQRALLRGLRVVAALSWPLAGAVAVLGPSLVLGLYGHEFERAALLVVPLSLGLLVAGPAMLAAMFWTGADRVRIPLIAAGAGAVADLGAAALLVPGHGAAGAVAANVLGQTVMCVLIVWLTARAIGRAELRPWRWVVAGIGAIIGFFAALAPVLVIGWDTAAAVWSGLLAGGLIGGAVWALYGRCVGYLDRDDARWFAAALPGRLAPLGRLVAR